MNLLARIRLKLSTTSPHRMRLIADVLLVCLLFWGTHAAYRGSTGHAQNCDSVYSLAVAEQLLTHGNVDLKHCATPGQELPYQLTRRGDSVYYGYPLGSTILSLPFVQTMSLNRGFTTFHADGRLNAPYESLLQLRIAADVSAAIVVLFYLMCRFYCSPLASAAIALGFAFGSPVWSTLSRALWSHTWMVAMLSVAIALIEWRRRIENASRRTELLFGLALGTALFWMLFARAHGIFSALGIGAYLLLHQRRLLVVTVGTGTLWVAALVAISLHAFGISTPPSVYSADSIDGKDVLNRFYWLMVSPSRGLLVYCPYVAVVGMLLAIYRKRLTDAGMLLPAGIAIAAHTGLFSCYDGWHMGSSYGPRYFSDLLPWFVLATAVAVRAILDSPGRIRVAAVVLLVMCFAWGGFVHGRGANAVKAWYWNWRPIAVGFEPAVKEWNHPQFLAGITFVVNPDGSVTEK